MNFISTTLIVVYLFLSHGVKSSPPSDTELYSDPITNSLKNSYYFDNNWAEVEAFVSRDLPTFIALAGHKTKLPYIISLYIVEEQSNQVSDPRTALQEKPVPFELDHMENNGAGLLAVCYFNNYVFQLVFS